ESIAISNETRVTFWVKIKTIVEITISNSNSAVPGIPVIWNIYSEPSMHNNKMPLSVTFSQ
ncbi:hypothetical protein ACVUMI_004542, partial [Klebsiella pneumoniae]